jgi:hypothetical protein
MRKTVAALILLSSLILVPSTGGQAPPPAEAPVRGTDIYAWCKFLAGPEFAGRLTGTPEYARAARWAASKFKEWGLRPLESAPEFLLPFPCSYTLVDKAELTVLAQAGADSHAPEEKPLVLGQDFLPYFFSGSGRVEAEAVFAGWGISAPDLGYDDYAGLDVKGKIVLCFQGVPASRAAALVEHNRHRSRQKTARTKGAAGIFYIQTGVAGSPNGEWDPSFLPGVLSLSAADRLFAEKNTTAVAAREALRTYERPISFTFRTKLRLAVESRHFESAQGFDAVGFLSGSDPALRGEVLVVGGHLDHLGRHLGRTYLGAQDNASGSAVVLALAKALRALPKAPRRSILFVLFGGEEMNYLGSQALAESLPPWVKKVDSMFNFDMNGVGSGVTVYITPGATALREALGRADAPVRILGDVLEINTKNPSGSDYVPFVLRGIPILSFFSNNFEARIHVPEDTIYQINPDMMADLANEAFRTIRILADR